MEGSLEGHLKEKYNIHNKIVNRKATPEEETGFMYVPINVMTNWLRKELKIFDPSWSSKDGLVFGRLGRRAARFKGYEIS